MHATRQAVRALALVGITGCTGGTDTASSSISTTAQPLRGAIFTTTADGTRVNANIYAAKTDVYLDGGPGPNAPSGAAALPPGDYYFQVTDPSGKTLLSTDDVACRRVTVGADGFIVAVGATGCSHATGVDADYGNAGAITVQLAPFADTPNHGGEYKAWITLVDAYAASGGFANRASKTDNFKVRTQSEAVCGNGIVEAGEECDDGNTVSGDGCSSTCKLEHPAVCGNGIVETGEQCDDGNTVNGDGCSSTCQTETTPCCGNGIVETGEQCDDGNTVSGDGCSATCQLEHPVCGNGIVEVGEQCDDGNTVNGDGCSSTCQTETTTPCCGNGIVEAGEQCDDGNTVGGDGCSATCQLEYVSVMIAWPGA